MAHLRRATMGLSVSVENTHPFTDGAVAFAHNGSVLHPGSLDRLVDRRVARQRRGTTDSERYFLALLTRMRDGAAPAEALLETADDIVAVSPFTSLNCLLVTPTELLALCRYDPSAPLEDPDPEYYRLRYRVAGEAVVVSSSGWGRDWQEVANGELLVVQRGSLDVSIGSGELLRPAA
jgi:predicted glutamine amidotransferase